MDDKTNIGTIINEETRRRLEIMKSQDYNWPEKADKKDYILIVFVISICILLIIMCLLGVIE